MNARYEFTEGSASKFWAVSVKGKVMSTHWGRIGAKGQSKEATFASPAKAKAAADKAAEKKMAKGYRLAGAKKSAPATGGAMDAKGLERELRKKFEFDKGGRFVGEGDKTWLGFQPPGKSYRYNIGRFCVIRIKDTDTHFQATTVLDGDSNEFILITEPGDYFNRVFWNDHEEGLYSLDCMVDYEDELDIDTYEGMSKSERIECMPFFEHPVADSLEELLAGVQAYTSEEFWSKEPVEGSADGDEEEEEEEQEGFAIGGDECWERLCELELASESLDMLGVVIDDLEDETILWIDEPWSELDYEELAADTAVGLAVFTQPVDVEGALSLSAEMLVGDPTMRDKRAFVFLGEVSCDSLLVLSDTISVFAGGLKARDFACFAAPDATTHVGVRLESDFVVSGHSAGNVTLWPGTQWNVKAMDGYAGGLATAARVLSFDAETIEDDSVNSVISNIIDGYTKVPKSFRFPPMPSGKAARKVSNASRKKSQTLRLNADELSDFLGAQLVSEGSRSLFRGNTKRLLSKPEDFALVVPDLKTARAISDGINARVIVVTQPVSAKETLRLRSLGIDDRSFGYWFCQRVLCLDVSLNFNGLAVFAGGLQARVVSTAPTDCHLRVDNYLECSVQCGSVHVANHASVDIGVVTGWFRGSADVSHALPVLAEEIEDGTMFQAVLEHFDELPALTLPPVAAVESGKKASKRSASAKKKATKNANKKSGIAGKSFCVTGTFSEKRSAIQARIEAAGGEVHKSVRASTDYLVKGEKVGASKLSAAAKHSVEVIDAKAFAALF